MDNVDLDPKSPEYGTMKLFPDANNPHNITLAPPPTDVRDSTLGSLMGRWGVVEGVLGIILQRLVKTDWDAARIILASGLTTVEIKDLIVALTRVRLEETLQNEAEKLGKRLKSLNTKRNRIVHGQWTMEGVNLAVPPGGPMAGIIRWVRHYTPTDPLIANKVNDLHNQKERTAYRFTLHQMVKLEAEMTKLYEDLAAFNETIAQILGPLSASPQPLP